MDRPAPNATLNTTGYWGLWEISTAKQNACYYTI